MALTSNERRDKAFWRKELLIPKNGTVREDSEAMAEKLGMSYSQYVVHALEEQIRRDRETLDSIQYEWLLVSDEMEISLRRRYAPGFVFSHRETAQKEQNVQRFLSEESAMSYIRYNEVHTVNRHITSRKAMCREYELRKCKVDGRNGKLISYEAVWHSDLPSDEF